MKGYVQVPLDSLVRQVGKGQAQKILSDFSCPLNKDVESFIRDKAIEFDMQGISKTHLIFCDKAEELVLIGYYTLANKVFEISKHTKLSSAWRHRLHRFTTYNARLNKHELSAPLIAQLGKNYANQNNLLIRGDELLKLACDRVQETHRILGGKSVFLECENNTKLIDFYQKNGFFMFDIRAMDYDERHNSDEYCLAQMIKYFE